MTDVRDDQLARARPFPQDGVDQRSGLIHDRGVFAFHSLHLLLVQHAVLKEFIQQAAERPHAHCVDELLPLALQDLVCLENKGASSHENGLTASRVGSRGGLLGLQP